MKVRDLMTTDVKSCSSDTNLAAAASRRWEGDCGALPVVDDDGKFIGMITDRNICMAVATRPQLASDILVGEASQGQSTSAIRLMRSNALGRSWSERKKQPVQPRRLSFRDGPILDSKLSQGGQSSAWNSRIYWTAQRSGAYLPRV
jgi:CBS domain protein